MKKLLSLALAAALALSLAACGATADTSDAADDAGAATDATTDAGDADAAADAGAAADAADASAAIKIGGTGPLTGGAAIYGNAAANGAKIAVDEINALGGMQFELRYEDDEHDPEKAVTAYNTLKDWGMQIFLGSVTTAPGINTSVEAAADRYFFLTPSASSTDVLGGVANPLTGNVDIERKDTVFQMCFADPNQGSASAQYIFDKKLGEKIAVIYKNDDAYSTGIYNSFKAKAEELGLAVVSETTFTEDTQTDFSVQVKAAQDAGADLVFLPMYYQPASLILTQANATGYAPKFFGVDGMDGILTQEGFDTALAEGVMLLTPFSADATDDLTVNFVTKYNDLYGETPNQFAADAYDCVYAIYNALQDSGLDASATHEDFCDYLVSAFAGDFTYDGLTGTAMSWDETGAVNKSPKGMVIQDGVYVGLD